jgi:hypothetical protein
MMGYNIAYRLQSGLRGKMAQKCGRNVSERNSVEPPTRASERCSISGLPLTAEQLRLRRLRKRLVLWFLLNVLLLCGTETLSRQTFSVGLLRLLLSLFGDLLIFVLCIQFSLIVLISCFNLTKRVRF